MKFVVSLEGAIDDRAAGRALVEEHLDGVMDELELLGAQDPSIDLDLEGGTVTLGVMVEAANPLLAVMQASGTLRTAIHAAGAATPDWPSPQAEVCSIQLLGVHSERVDAPSLVPDGDLAGV